MRDKELSENNPPYALIFRPTRVRIVAGCTELVVHARRHERADRREGERQLDHGPQLRGEAFLRPLEAIRAVPPRRSLPDGLARQPAAGGDLCVLLLLLLLQ